MTTILQSGGAQMSLLQRCASTFGLPPPTYSPTLIHAVALEVEAPQIQYLDQVNFAWHFNYYYCYIAS